MKMNSKMWCYLQAFLLLAVTCDVTSGWIRFRYPVSRREYLQQTSLEKLQNCAGKKECGICGEGPGEISTSLISTSDYTPVTPDKFQDGVFKTDVAFRSGVGTTIEFRLCSLTDNSTEDARVCHSKRPLVVKQETGSPFQNDATGNVTQYYPDVQQTSARVPLEVSGLERCDRCIIQAKYIPGQQSELKRHTFYDCALLTATTQGSGSAARGSQQSRETTRTTSGDSTVGGRLVGVETTILENKKNVMLSETKTTSLEPSVSLGRINPPTGTIGANDGNEVTRVITRTDTWTFDVDPSLIQAGKSQGSGAGEEPVVQFPSSASSAAKATGKSKAITDGFTLSGNSTASGQTEEMTREINLSSADGSVHTTLSRLLSGLSTSKANQGGSAVDQTIAKFLSGLASSGSTGTITIERTATHESTKDPGSSATGDSGAGFKIVGTATSGGNVNTIGTAANGGSGSITVDGAASSGQASGMESVSSTTSNAAVDQAISKFISGLSSADAGDQAISKFIKGLSDNSKGDATFTVKGAVSGQSMSSTSSSATSGNAGTLSGNSNVVSGASSTLAGSSSFTVDGTATNTVAGSASTSGTSSKTVEVKKVTTSVDGGVSGTTNTGGKDGSRTITFIDILSDGDNSGGVNTAGSSQSSTGTVNIAGSSSTGVATSTLTGSSNSVNLDSNLFTIDGSLSGSLDGMNRLSGSGDITGSVNIINRTIVDPVPILDPIPYVSDETLNNLNRTYMTTISKETQTFTTGTGATGDDTMTIRKDPGTGTYTITQYGNITTMYNSSLPYTAGGTDGVSGGFSGFDLSNSSLIYDETLGGILNDTSGQNFTLYNGTESIFNKDDYNANVLAESIWALPTVDVSGTSFDTTISRDAQASSVDTIVNTGTTGGASTGFDTSRVNTIVNTATTGTGTGSTGFNQVSGANIGVNTGNVGGQTSTTITREVTIHTVGGQSLGGQGIGVNTANIGGSSQTSTVNREVVVNTGRDVGVNTVSVGGGQSSTVNKEVVLNTGGSNTVTVGGGKASSVNRGIVVNTGLTTGGQTSSQNGGLLIVNATTIGGSTSQTGGNLRVDVDATGGSRTSQTTFVDTGSRTGGSGASHMVVTNKTTVHVDTTVNKGTDELWDINRTNRQDVATSNQTLITVNTTLNQNRDGLTTLNQRHGSRTDNLVNITRVGGTAINNNQAVVDTNQASIIQEIVDVPTNIIVLPIGSDNVPAYNQEVVDVNIKTLENKLNVGQGTLGTSDYTNTNIDRVNEYATRNTRFGDAVGYQNNTGGSVEGVDYATTGNQVDGTVYGQATGGRFGNIITWNETTVTRNVSTTQFEDGRTDIGTTRSDLIGGGTGFGGQKVIVGTGRTDKKVFVDGANTPTTGIAVGREATGIVTIGGSSNTVSGNVNVNTQQGIVANIDRSTTGVNTGTISTGQTQKVITSVVDQSNANTGGSNVGVGLNTDMGGSEVITSVTREDVNNPGFTIDVNANKVQTGIKVTTINDQDRGVVDSASNIAGGTGGVFVTGTVGRADNRPTNTGIVVGQNIGGSGAGIVVNQNTGGQSVNTVTKTVISTSNINREVVGSGSQSGIVVGDLDQSFNRQTVVAGGGAGGMVDSSTVNTFEPVSTTAVPTAVPMTTFRTPMNTGRTSGSDISTSSSDDYFAYATSERSPTPTQQNQVGFFIDESVQVDKFGGIPIEVGTGKKVVTNENTVLTNTLTNQQAGSKRPGSFTKYDFGNMFDVLTASTSRNRTVDNSFDVTGSLAKPSNRNVTLFKWEMFANRDNTTSNGRALTSKPDKVSNIKSIGSLNKWTAAGLSDVKATGEVKPATVVFDVSNTNTKGGAAVGGRGTVRPALFRNVGSWDASRTSVSVNGINQAVGERSLIDKPSTTRRPNVGSWDASRTSVSINGINQAVGERSLIDRPSTTRRPYMGSWEATRIAGIDKTVGERSLIDRPSTTRRPNIGSWEATRTSVNIAGIDQPVGERSLIDKPLTTRRPSILRKTAEVKESKVGLFDGSTFTRVSSDTNIPTLEASLRRSKPFDTSFTVGVGSSVNSGKLDANIASLNRDFNVNSNRGVNVVETSKIVNWNRDENALNIPNIPSLNRGVNRVDTTNVNVNRDVNRVDTSNVNFNRDVNRVDTANVNLNRGVNIVDTTNTRLSLNNETPPPVIVANRRKTPRTPNQMNLGIVINGNAGINRVDLHKDESLLNMELFSRQAPDIMPPIKAAKVNLQKQPVPDIYLDMKQSTNGIGGAVQTKVGEWGGNGVVWGNVVNRNSGDTRLTSGDRGTVVRTSEVRTSGSQASGIQTSGGRGFGGRNAEVIVDGASISGGSGSRDEIKKTALNETTLWDINRLADTGNGVSGGVGEGKVIGGNTGAVSGTWQTISNTPIGVANAGDSSVYISETVTNIDYQPGSGTGFGSQTQTRPYDVTYLVNNNTGGSVNDATNNNVLKTLEALMLELKARETTTDLKQTLFNTNMERQQNGLLVDVGQANMGTRQNGVMVDVGNTLGANFVDDRKSGVLVNVGSTLGTNSVDNRQSVNIGGTVQGTRSETNRQTGVLTNVGNTVKVGSVKDRNTGVLVNVGSTLGSTSVNERTVVGNTVGPTSVNDRIVVVTAPTSVDQAGSLLNTASGVVSSISETINRVPDTTFQVDQTTVRAADNTINTGSRTSQTVSTLNTQNTVNKAEIVGKIEPLFNVKVAQMVDDIQHNRNIPYNIEPLPVEPVVQSTGLDSGLITRREFVSSGIKRSQLSTGSDGTVISTLPVDQPIIQSNLLTTSERNGILNRLSRLSNKFAEFTAGDRDNRTGVFEARAGGSPATMKSRTMMSSRFRTKSTRGGGGGFNSGTSNGGSGFNPGTSSGGSGFNPGTSNGGSGFNPGTSNGGSGFNPGTSNGGSGFNPGTSNGGSGFNPGTSNGGSGFNPGTSNGGSGFNPGTSNGGSGFNPGTSNGGSGFNPGTSNGGSGFNPGTSNGGSGFNPGTGGGSGFNPGTSNGGSGFNPGTSSGGSGFNPGARVRSRARASRRGGGSGFNPGTGGGEGFNPGTGGGEGFNPGTGGGEGFNPGTGGGEGFNPGTGGGEGFNPGTGGGEGFNPGTGGGEGFNPGTGGGEGFNPGTGGGEGFNPGTGGGGGFNPGTGGGEGFNPGTGGGEGFNPGTGGGEGFNPGTGGGEGFNPGARVRSRARASTRDQVIIHRKSNGIDNPFGNIPRRDSALTTIHGAVIGGNDNVARDQVTTNSVIRSSTSDKFTNDISSSNKFGDGISSSNKFGDGISTSNKFTDDISTSNKFTNDISTSNKFTDGISTSNKFGNDISTSNKFGDGISTSNKFGDGISTSNKFGDGISTSNKFTNDISTSNKFTNDGISTSNKFTNDISTSNKFGNDISTSNKFTNDISTSNKFGDGISTSNKATTNKQLVTTSSDFNPINSVANTRILDVTRSELVVPNDTVRPIATIIEPTEPRDLLINRGSSTDQATRVVTSSSTFTTTGSDSTLIGTGLDGTGQQVGFNPDLISIEGKYYVGHMRRNDQGHFEPVPMAADVNQGTGAGNSDGTVTVIESTGSVLGETGGSGGMVSGMATSEQNVRQSNTLRVDPLVTGLATSGQTVRDSGTIRNVDTTVSRTDTSSSGFANVGRSSNTDTGFVSGQGFGDSRGVTTVQEAGPLVTDNQSRSEIVSGFNERTGRVDAPETSGTVTVSRSGTRGQIDRVVSDVDAAQTGTLTIARGGSLTNIDRVSTDPGQTGTLTIARGGTLANIDRATSESGIEPSGSLTVARGGSIAQINRVASDTGPAVTVRRDGKGTLTRVETVSSAATEPTSAINTFTATREGTGARRDVNQREVTGARREVNQINNAGFTDDSSIILNSRPIVRVETTRSRTETASTNRGSPNIGLSTGQGNTIGGIRTNIIRTDNVNIADDTRRRQDNTRVFNAEGVSGVRTDRVVSTRPVVRDNTRTDRIVNTLRTTRPSDRDNTRFLNTGGVSGVRTDRMVNTVRTTRPVDRDNFVGVAGGRTDRMANTVRATRPVTRDNFAGQNVLLKTIGNRQTTTRDNFIGQEELLRSIRDKFGVNINTQGLLGNVDVNAKVVAGDVYTVNGGAGKTRCRPGHVLVCEAVGLNQNIPGMVWWCFSHCQNGICPTEKCDCSCESPGAQRNRLSSTGSVTNNTGVQFTSGRPNTNAVTTTRGKQKVQKFIKLTLNGSEERLGPVRAIAGSSRDMGRNPVSATSIDSTRSIVFDGHRGPGGAMPRGIGLPSTYSNGGDGVIFADSTITTSSDTAPRIAARRNDVTFTRRTGGDVMRRSGGDVMSRSGDVTARVVGGAQTRNGDVTTRTGTASTRSRDVTIRTTGDAAGTSRDVLNSLRNMIKKNGLNSRISATEPAISTGTSNVNTITETVSSTVNTKNSNVNTQNTGLKCIGINAFANTDGMTAWCTRMCGLDMCPLDICSCS